MNIQLFHQLNNLLFHNVTFDTWVYYCAVFFPYCLFAVAAVFLIFYPTENNGGSWLLGMPKRIVKFFYAIFTVGGAYLVTAIIKHVVQNPRPFVVLQDTKILFTDTGYSFPSSHAGAFAALATVIYFHHKPAGILFGIAAVLISIARVIGGVHYPLDIIVGWGIGIGVAILMNRLWKSIAKKVA